VSTPRAFTNSIKEGWTDAADYLLDLFDDDDAPGAPNLDAAALARVEAKRDAMFEDLISQRSARGGGTRIDITPDAEAHARANRPATSPMSSPRGCSSAEDTVRPPPMAPMQTLEA
jgi:hypothetical protein